LQAGEVEIVRNRNLDRLPDQGFRRLPAANKKGGPREAAFLIRFTVHKTEKPSRPWEWAVLEVILQNPRGQCGG
jgi:hypothetical protein